MTISPVNAPPIGIGAFNPNSLTADSLMTYCQTQLGNIDGEVKAYFEQQQKMLAEKKVLSELQTALAKYDPPNTKEASKAIGEALEKAYNELASLNPNGELAKKVLQITDDLLPKMGQTLTTNPAQHTITVEFGSTPKGVTKAYWTSQVDEVKGMISSVSGNAELNMIQLQSLMSKRQTAVQLTTNMLSKYDQTIAGIVNNVK
ncbi:MAG: hypothetical protein R3B13_32980 [Polyangiaceae bacterium]